MIVLKYNNKKVIDLHDEIDINSFINGVIEKAKERGNIYHKDLFTWKKNKSDIYLSIDEVLYKINPDKYNEIRKEFSISADNKHFDENHSAMLEEMEKAGKVLGKIISFNY